MTFRNMTSSQTIEEWNRTEVLEASCYEIRCVEGSSNVRSIQIGNSGWLCDSRDRREEGHCGARRRQLREGWPRLLGGGPYLQVYSSWSHGDRRERIEVMNQLILVLIILAAVLFVVDALSRAFKYQIMGYEPTI